MPSPRLALLLALGAVGCAPLSSSMRPNPPALPSAAQDDRLRSAVESTLGRIEDGWNTRDAALFASAFTEPHDYVAVGGRLTLGQTAEQNRAVHERIWSTIYAEGSTIALELLAVDELAPGVAVATARSRDAYVRGGEARSHESILSLTLTDAGGTWLIRQLSNNLSQRE